MIDTSSDGDALTGPSTFHLSEIALSESAVLLEARRFVRNWLVVGIRAKAAKTLTGGEFAGQVRLRDNRPPISVRSASEVSLALYAGYLASKWGDNPDVTVRHLHDIASNLNARMRQNYPPSEVASGQTGGWTGPKEAALYLITRGVKPRTVVETGVAQGVSSTFILTALHENAAGRLTSIDLPREGESGESVPPEPQSNDRVYVKSRLGTGWIVPDDLRYRWTLIIDDAKWALPRITGEVDLFFHDSLHTYSHMMFEYNWALEHMHKGSILVSDDINWNRAFHDFVARNRDRLSVISSTTVGIAVCVA